MGAYVPRLLHTLGRELRCSDAANRRNAAFAAGMLAQAAPEAVAPHLPSLLQVMLWPCPVVASLMHGWCVAGLSLQCFSMLR